MRFLTAVSTDIGIRKKTNQDSALIMEAETELGNVLFAVVCDGMGGLAKGEVASATVINKYENWFKNIFPNVLYSDYNDETIKKSIEDVLFDVNEKIVSYGKEIGTDLGTTAVALLIIDNRYYCVNIGDSRCYNVKDSFKLITKDQSFVQREIDMGRLTYEEALNHPQRSVLLQCIGASDFISPDLYIGKVNPNEVFLLCSDGFRHVIKDEEFYYYLNPNALQNEEQMNRVVKYYIELNKNRREQDNITAILVRTV